MGAVPRRMARTARTRRTGHGSGLGLLHRHFRLPARAHPLDPCRSRAVRRGNAAAAAITSITTTSASQCWRRWQRCGLRGTERQRRHPMAAVAFGSANAIIVDELALLLDLEDVYWATDGRESVDAAVGLIAAGGTTRCRYTSSGRMHGGRCSQLRLIFHAYDRHPHTIADFRHRRPPRRIRNGWPGFRRR